MSAVQWFLWALVPAVLAVAAVAGSGRLGGLPPDAVRDVPTPTYDPGPLTGDDVRGVLLAIEPRGYSTAQVDDLLDRLARQLDAGTLPPSAIMAPSQTSNEGAHGAGNRGSADGCNEAADG